MIPDTTSNPADHDTAIPADNLSVHDNMEHGAAPGLIGFLDTMGGNVLADPKLREQAFQAASAHELIGGVIALHAALMGNTAEQAMSRSMTAGDQRNGEESVGMVFVTPDKRYELLEYAIGLGKNTDSLAVKADLAAYAITLAHAFPDGNGRLARVTQKLIADGYDGSAVGKASMLVAAAGRDTLPSSERGYLFLERVELKRSLVYKDAEEHGIAPSSILSTEKELIEKYGRTDENGYGYVSKKRVEEAISTDIADPDMRENIRRIVQQPGFGPLVLEQMRKEQGAQLSLETMTQADGDRLLALEADNKYRYAKNVLDMIVGKEVPSYLLNGEQLKESPLKAGMNLFGMVSS
jgi:hypothetical protein